MRGGADANVAHVAFHVDESSWNASYNTHTECFHNRVEIIATIIGYCERYNASNAPMQADKKTQRKKIDNPHLP